MHSTFKMAAVAVASFISFQAHAQNNPHGNNPSLSPPVLPPLDPVASFTNNCDLVIDARTLRLQNTLNASEETATKLVRYILDSTIKREDRCSVDKGDIIVRLESVRSTVGKYTSNTNKEGNSVDFSISQFRLALNSGRDANNRHAPALKQMANFIRPGF